MWWSLTMQGSARVLMQGRIYGHYYYPRGRSWQKKNFHMPCLDGFGVFNSKFDLVYLILNYLFLIHAAAPAKPLSRQEVLALDPYHYLYVHQLPPMYSQIWSRPCGFSTHGGPCKFRSITIHRRNCVHRGNFCHFTHSNKSRRGKFCPTGEKSLLRNKAARCYHLLIMKLNVPTLHGDKQRSRDRLRINFGHLRVFNARQNLEHAGVFASPLSEKWLPQPGIEPISLDSAAHRLSHWAPSG